MAQYKTHSMINLFIALPPLVAASLYLFKQPMGLVLIGAGAFAYGTLFMSPDVDLTYNVKWGSVRGILSFPFRTYAKVFAHRGLSHSILFGTLTRVIWLGMYVFAALLIVYQVVPTKKTLMAFYLSYKLPLIASFAGLFLADACHIIVDKLSD
jgi:uncharacterized metal-binding protein